MSEVNQGPEVVSVPPPPASGSGLSDNVAGALAYVTIIPAILFLVLEPYNRSPFVRFHSFQSIGLAVVCFIISVIMVIPILGWLIGLVGYLVVLVAWVMCLAKAYQGQYFKLPIVGNIVEGMAK